MKEIEKRIIEHLQDNYFVGVGYPTDKGKAALNCCYFIIVNRHTNKSDNNISSFKFIEEFLEGMGLDKKEFMTNNLEMVKQEYIDVFKITKMKFMDSLVGRLSGQNIKF